MAAKRTAKPKAKAKAKPKRDRYGFQSPQAEARTEPVVHWRCDVCELEQVEDRRDGRPEGWIDVKVFGLGASYLTRCCPRCALVHAMEFTLEKRRIIPLCG